MLLQRVAKGADALDPRQALRLATRGGAEMLGRRDCGVLKAGQRADIAIWDLEGLSTAGAWDPVAALILCAPVSARDVFVDGRVIVRAWQLALADAGDIRARADRSLRRLMA